MATVRIQLRRGTSSQWDNANPTLAAGEIGIETDTNTFKFGDGVTAWNSLDYALSDTVDDYIPLSLKGAANGVAELDGQGYVPAAQLPPLAKVTVNAVADQSARLALTVEPGDIAIQSDNGTTYVLQSSPASTNANWKEISATAAISAAVSAHEADTSNVHGIVDTSLLVTTTGTQTLTNKTLTSPVINTPTGIVKADVGLSNVDNTSDLNKPVSTAQAAADTAVANDAANALSNHESNGVNVHGISDTASLVTVDGTQTLTNKTLTSPELTGTPIAPTAASNTNNTQIATTAFAKSVADIAQSNAEQYATSQITAVIGTAPAALNTLQELAAAINDDANYAGTVTNSITNINTSINNINNDLALKAPLASPTFTGTVGLPSSTNIGDVSNVELGYLNGVTSGIQSQIDAKLDSTVASSTYAPLASPTFTGNVTLPSSTSIGDISNVELAYLNGVTSGVQSQIDAKLDSTVASSTYAPLASPTFTGNVSLPSSTSIGDISNVELAYLNGVTSGVQSQIDAKLDSTIASSTYAPLASPTFTGNVTLPSSTSIGDVSNLELGYLSNVTSDLQTQLNSKAPLASPTFTGTVILPNNTVTGAMIADTTIPTGKISDTAITAAKLASSAVETDKINDAAVTTAKINDGAVTSAKIADGTIVNADINESAAIDWTKLAISSTVSATELGYVDGVTSAIQTQIDSKLASATAASTYAPIASPTFTGTVSGVSKSMVGLGNVDNTADADKPVSTATQTALDAKLSLSGGTMTGELTLSGAPTQDAHAATKAYVDNVSAGINFHQPVRVATTGNITLSGTQTIDGVAVIAGDRVLVKDQTTQTQNGIYVVASGAWTRATDADNTPNGELAGGDFTLVLEGTVNSGYGYVCSNTSAITIGTTNVTYAAFNAAKAVTAGTGLTETTPGTLAVDSSTVQYRVSGVSDTEIGYLDGVTSAIQTQLDAKAPTANPTFTGTVTVAASGVAFTDGTQTKEGVPSRTTINSATGTYNLSTGGLALRDTLIECNSASAFTVTIPANSTTAYPVGTSIDLLQTGAGQITVAPAAGVTLNGTPGLKLRTQWSSATLFKRATDTWVIMGDLTA